MLSFIEFIKIKETGTMAGNIATVPSKVPFGVVTRGHTATGLADIGSYSFPSKKKKSNNRKYNNKIDEVHWDSGLGKWLKEKWVDISRKDKSGKHPSCGASAKKQGRHKDQKKSYPKCRPAAEASSMSKSEKKRAVAQKRRAENKKAHTKGRKPIVVSHKENYVFNKKSFKQFVEDLDNVNIDLQKPVAAMVSSVNQAKSVDMVEVYFEKQPTNVKGDFALTGTIILNTKQGLNRSEVFNEIYKEFTKRIHIEKISDDFGKTKEVHVFDKLNNNLIKTAYFENIKDCKVEIFKNVEKFAEIKNNQNLLNLINNFDKFKNKNGQIEIKFKFILPSLMV